MKWFHFTYWCWKSYKNGTKLNTLEWIYAQFVYESLWTVTDNICENQTYRKMYGKKQSTKTPTNFMRISIFIVLKIWHWRGKKKIIKMLAMAHVLYIFHVNRIKAAVKESQYSISTIQKNYKVIAFLRMERCWRRKTNTSIWNICDTMANYLITYECEIDFMYRSGWKIMMVSRLNLNYFV